MFAPPRVVFLGLALFALCGSLRARPNLESNIERTLRYAPEDRGFLIRNGNEAFNRSLYSPHAPFRIDAGDRPEFLVYLPGRGGNLRLGLRVGAQSKWLLAADQIEARYKDGAMEYTIRDALLRGDVLRIGVVATVNSAALICVERVGFAAGTDVEIVAAYGGVTGKRASRDGDIGTEKKPISEFFQLTPEACEGNSIEIKGSVSEISLRQTRVAQIWPSSATVSTADAAAWASVGQLIASAGISNSRSVALARFKVSEDTWYYIAAQRITEELSPKDRLTAEQLPNAYATARIRARAVANQVTVDTPDPFINSAVSALCVAADGMWDDKAGAFMHGAVAWRVPLLGWRGVYMGDALGWPQRTEKHLSRWFDPKTATPGVIMEGEAKPVEAKEAAAPTYGDPAANLSRNEPLLHSEGDLTKSHYDMNLVAVDAFFRHLRWTGDLEFARRFWPVIEKHFAWEQRLFRRPYKKGAEELPLYEAYAAIWASDDVEYHGGGATHSSAYLYWQYTQAAEVAKRLGFDGEPYAREAQAIRRAMRELLWLPDRGWYAEWKDWLGRAEAHPDPAVWSFYHAVDSEAMTPLEAWQMTRFIDTEIAHIPLRGPGVPAGAFTIPTSRWMPYTWSTNNVVMAEVAHTALGYWQANRSDIAFRLLKGAILDSMFTGICPGNVGMCTGFDMARGESQRDFADGCGSLSRSVIEGLFGIKPDAIAGELVVAPGFPAEWDRAKISHPSVELSYQRSGYKEQWKVGWRGAPLALRLRLRARADAVTRVLLDGKAVEWRAIDDAVGEPVIEVAAPAARNFDVEVDWSGAAVEGAAAESAVVPGGQLNRVWKKAAVVDFADPQASLANIKRKGNTIAAEASGRVGHRVAFAKLRQGQMIWWEPLLFEIREPYTVVEGADKRVGVVKARILNHTAAAIDGEFHADVNGAATRLRLPAPAGDNSAMFDLTENAVPGTNRLRVQLGNGQSIDGAVTNWNVQAPATARWETIDLTSHFNDRVTQIFRNEYLSPRSPFCSLAIPKQGIGSWCRFNATAQIDDRGLRAKSDAGHGVLTLPQGIPLRTPGSGDAKNILFTSQWDNYPKEATVPLKGSARHAYLLMAGSTNWMQSRFENGEVIVRYTDGSTERLPLVNPTNWWPIDQDYLIDDYAFARPEPIPPRVDLATGEVRILNPTTFKGKGGIVPGGAATVLDLPLDQTKTLESLTVRTLANEVVIGLMAVTLMR